MLNDHRGAGIHVPNNTWKNKRHVFDLTLGAGTLKLPDSTTLDDDFEFEFFVKSIGPNTLEVRCDHDGDELNGHWRNKVPVWQTDVNGDYVLDGNQHRIFSHWGAAQKYGLFAGLTQTSGKVIKLATGEFGFAKWRSIWSGQMSQDTVVADAVQKSWTLTPRSSGETVVVNPDAGLYAPQDIYINIDHLNEWCPPHMNPAWGYGNYLNHSVTIKNVGTGNRVVGIGCADGTHIFPSNDLDINPGLPESRGYLYILSGETVVLRITQATVDVVGFSKASDIAAARLP